jgi:hypothetical protein
MTSLVIQVIGAYDDNELSKKSINTVVKHGNTNLWYCCVVVVALAPLMCGGSSSLGSC